MGATIYLQPQTVITASGSSGPLNVGPLTTLACDVNVVTVAGTSPTLSLVVERQGADGGWYPMWTPAAITAAGITSTSIGPGCATNQVVPATIRFRWTLGGTSPSFTYSVSIVGR
jgi:hypothetical protein